MKLSLTNFMKILPERLSTFHETLLRDRIRIDAKQMTSTTGKTESSETEWLHGQ